MRLRTGQPKNTFGLALSLFLLTLLTPFLYPSVTYAATDPIAYWKFDDGSGTAPIDSSGNSITGSFLTPNPTWSTDVPSSITFSDPYSLDFTRNNDGVSFTWPSGLNFSSNAARSFSFWYKPTANGEPDAGSYDRIVSWSNDGFEIAGTLGDVSVHRLAFYDGNWRDTGYDMTVGTWYHITFTYDGTNVKLYVDDTEKFSGTSGGRALSGTITIGLRENGHNEGINGRIDDMRVYNYALSTTQISNLTAGSSDPDTTPSAPTVSTGSASSVEQTSATLGGTISSTGTASVTKRGFHYGTSNSYGSTVSATSTSFSTGAYSGSLSSLTCGTTYHFRAFAVNSVGTSTGSDATLTASACASSSSSSSSSTTNRGNGPIFTGPASALPGYTTPRAQIIYPDGRRVYVDTTASTPTQSVPENTSVKLCPYYAFTRSLSFGDHGSDVRALQAFLNCAGFTLASSGPGSPNKETEYFSKRTLKALMTFQNTYLTDIITAAGFKKPTGIFAHYSQKKAYALMLPL